MDTDQFSKKEIEQRQKKALAGAFAGPPTPLKDIPTKTGESRALKRKAKPKKKAQNRVAAAK